MKSIAQYQHLVEELKIEPHSKKEMTTAAAKKALASLDELEIRARQLETSLALDRQAFMAQYLGRSAALNKMNRHDQSGKAKGAEEHRLQIEQGDRLAPFESLKTRLTEILAAIEKQRSELAKLSRETKKAGA